MDGVVLAFFLLAAFLGAVTTGVAGFAMGLVVSGIWPHILPPVQTVSLMVSYSVLLQGYGVWKLRHALDWRRVAPFIVGGAIGVPIGAMLLAHVNPAYLRTGVGLVLLLYSIYYLARPALEPVQGGVPADIVIGFLNGVLGGLTGLVGIVAVIFRPAAPLAPDDRDDPDEAGESAEHPVEKSDHYVGGNSALHRLERRTRQVVDAVEQQHQAHPGAQVGRVDVRQQHRADRHADRAADDERRDSAPVERVPQLPHAVALQQNAVAHHQAYGLDRRQDVQPYAGDHEAHGETGDTGRHRAEKCRQEKKPENHAIHRSLPNEVTSAWMAEPSRGEAAFPLQSSACRALLKSQRALMP